MKYQDLFSLKNKKKEFRMSSATILLGALRVKMFFFLDSSSYVELPYACDFFFILYCFV